MSLGRNESVVLQVPQSTTEKEEGGRGTAQLGSADRSFKNSADIIRNGSVFVVHQSEEEEGEKDFLPWWSHLVH